MANLRALESADLDAVGALMDRRLKGSSAAWRERLPWQRDSNPWRSADAGGTVLVEAKRVVGYHFYVAQPMQISGAQCQAHFALDLFIDPAFRDGLNSIGLIKAIAPVDPECVMATSTANEISVAVWRRLGAKAQSDGDIALVKPVRHGRLMLAAAERGLRGRPQAHIPRSWHAAPEDCAEIELRSQWSGRSLATRFEAAAQFWQQVRHQYPLSTDRTEAYLRWRYAPSSPGGTVIGLFDAVGTLRAWYAFRSSQRGSAVRFSVFKVLDIIADPHDRDAIAACVDDMTHRARALADIIEVRGMRSEIRAGLRAAEFRARRLASNPFLVAAKPRRSRPLPTPDSWHLVPADGDAGFA